MRWIVLPLLALGMFPEESSAATITAQLKSGASAAIAAASYSAKGNKIQLSLGFAPTPGKDLTVVLNNGLPFIGGEFSNLAQGSEVFLDFEGVTYRFIANYFGGSGNDLELIWPREGVSAWGGNDGGQLGIGSVVKSSTVPVDVETSGVLFGKTIISAAGGGGHSVAACSDGTLVAWGDNRSGQLGTRGKPNSLVPAKVITDGALKGKRVIQVSAGASHSLALCSDGTVFAWGSNSDGQLGVQKPAKSLEPLKVPTTGGLAGKSVVSVSAGYYHSLALCSDGSVVSWGANSEGQLGIGGRVDKHAPVAVDAGGVLKGRKVASISAGDFFSTALCSDGSVAAWGINRKGQLGDGTLTRRETPVLVKFTKAQTKIKMVSLSSGTEHTVALASNGQAFSWGANDNGQLGSGSAEKQSPPVAVSTSGALKNRKLAAVSVGGYHSFGRCLDGTLVAWGRGNSGELGNNTASPSSPVPVKVMETGALASGSAKLMVSGGRSGVAVSTIPPGPGLKKLAVTGATLSPAFSRGTTVYQVKVAESVSSVVLTPTGEIASSIKVNGAKVASGKPGAAIPLTKGINTISIRSTGANGETMDYSIFVRRGDVLKLDFTSAAAGIQAGTALDLTGMTADLSLGFAPPPGTVLKLVGNTGSGQFTGEISGLVQGQLIRLPYQGLNYPFVVNYHGGDGNDLVLQWGYQHAYAWGYNGKGQLGDAGRWGLRGTDVPVEVARDGVLADKIVTQVSASESSGLALCSDGSVVRWGNGDNVPSLLDHSGALAGRTVIAVAAGYSCNLALCSDGTVASWGIGSNGQLGDGSGSSSDIPVEVDRSGVLAGKTVVAISAGFYHCLALCSDGTVVAWGSGYFGNLGNGTNVDSNVPVAVSTSGVLSGKKVTSIGAGYGHSLVLCSDGTVAAWGGGTNGELGTGNAADSNVPVAVNSGALSGKNVIAISAGGSHNLVLCSDRTVVAWGSAFFGSLGDNGVSSGLLPVSVDASGVLAGKTVVGVAAGVACSRALLSDGSVAAWGRNDWGQVGDGSRVDRSVPVLVSNAGGPGQPAMLSVAGGSLHGLAVGAAPLSDDSALTGLEISAGVLDYAPSPDRTQLVASTPIHATSLTVTPTARDSNARIAVNGVVVESGSPSVPVSLNIGAASTTLISITVTAEDGSTTVYQIEARRAATVGGTLSAASDILLTAPAFSANDVHANLHLDFDPAPGTSLMLVNNTGLNFIQGHFLELQQGQVIVLSSLGLNHQFVVNYYGGDGNDLVLEWKNRTIATWGENAQGQLGNGANAAKGVPVEVSGQGVLAGRIVLSVAAGSDHTLALCDDGTLAAWGMNSSGQLGDGTNTHRNVPVAVNTSGVLAGKRPIAVSAGGTHSLVLCSDGTLVTFGSSGGAFPIEKQRVGALAGKSIVRISAGTDHDLALCSDGSVVFWESDFPPPVSPGGEGWPHAFDRSGLLAGKMVSGISAGGDQDLALCSDGTVVSWSESESSTLEPGHLIDRVTPQSVDLSGLAVGKSVVSVEAGYAHRLLRCSDGTLFSWGANSSGVLGTGSQSSSLIPKAVDRSGILDGKTVLGMAAGQYHNLAVCTDGTLAAWGSNSVGQRGDGTYNPPSSPTPAIRPVSVVRTGLLSDKTVTSLSAGASHSVAIAAVPVHPGLSGLVVNSGYLDSAYQPGKIIYQISLPATTSTFTVTATAIDPGTKIVINGQEVPSGVASAPISFTPSGQVHVTATAENGVTRDYLLIMPANVYLTMYSPTEGSLASAGYAATGWEIFPSLGFVPATGANLTLIRNTGTGFIDGRFSNLTQGQQVNLTYGGKTYPFVANYFGGTGNDLVLEWASRSLASWGNNGQGQMGVAPSANVAVPTAVMGLGALAGNTVTSVAAGATHSLALGVDGTIATWGGGSLGQLGAGPTTQSTEPLAVTANGALSGKTAAGISAANCNNLVVCSDGSVVAWGYGGYGQLGNGSTANSFTPVAVSMTGPAAGKKVVSVAVGGTHCLAVCSDGSVLAWGKNNLGQLGSGNTHDETTPVLVSSTGALAGKTVVAVSGGYQHSLALCSDGTLVAWGDNSSGQLGATGNTAFVQQSVIPVVVNQTAILAGKTVVALSQAAHSTSIVLCSDGTVVSWGRNSEGERGSAGGTAAVPGLVTNSGVLSGKSVSYVSSGGSSSLAVCSDGSTVTWGSNSYRQLGNDGTAISASPVAVVDNGVLTGKKALFGAVAYHCILVMADPLESPLPAKPLEASVADSSSMADPDGDGIPNLVEYVLHGNPNATSTEILPRMTVEGGDFVFDFNRLAASADDTIQAFQYSTDMTTWIEVSITPPTGEGVVIGPVDANGCQTVTVRVGKSSNTPMFGRLRVLRP